MNTATVQPHTISCLRCPVRTRHVEGPATDEDLARLSSVVTHRRYRGGQTLYIEGHRAEHVFFVRVGAVRLTRLEHDGAEMLLDFVIPGGVLGAEALFGAEHSATATAAGILVCCTVPATVLRDLLRSQPGVALGLLRLVHEDLDRLRSRVAELAAWSAERRVARFLLKTLPEWRVHVREFTQADVARSLALAPETFCRVLADFRQRDWIAGHGRTLTVLQEEPLSSLVMATGCG